MLFTGRQQQSRADQSKPDLSLRLAILDSNHLFEETWFGSSYLEHRLTTLPLPVHTQMVDYYSDCVDRILQFKTGQYNEYIASNRFKIYS